MRGDPGLVVFGIWATVFGLSVGLDLVEDEPTVRAVPDGEVVGTVLPRITTVLVALRDRGVAGVADHPPP